MGRFLLLHVLLSKCVLLSFFAVQVYSADVTPGQGQNGPTIRVYYPGTNITLANLQVNYCTSPTCTFVAFSLSPASFHLLLSLFPSHTHSYLLCSIHSYISLSLSHTHTHTHKLTSQLDHDYIVSVRAVSSGGLGPVDVPTFFSIGMCATVFVVHVFSCHGCECTGWRKTNQRGLHTREWLRNGAILLLLAFFFFWGWCALEIIYQPFYCGIGRLSGNNGPFVLLWWGYPSLPATSNVPMMLQHFFQGGQQVKLWFLMCSSCSVTSSWTRAV